MNGQSAPIPELCLHYIREIRKAQKESKPVDPRLWFKTLKRRGVNVQDVTDRLIPKGEVFPAHDVFASVFKEIKKEYEIYG